MTSAAVRFGRREKRRATAPATWGAAMLVPRSIVYSPPARVSHGAAVAFWDRAEAIQAPGAVRSGLRRPSRVGPRDENEASAPTSPSAVSSPATEVQWVFVM